jgi:hypothetical protein
MGALEIWPAKQRPIIEPKPANVILFKASS